MIHPGGTIGRRAHRKLLATGAALVIMAGLAACEDSQQSPGSLVGDLDTRDLVEGVTYREFIDDQSGALVRLLKVDLASPGVAVEAVTPGMVSEAEQPTVMAQAAGATAVVNGDFFNNRSDRHPLAAHTYASLTRSGRARPSSSPEMAPPRTSTASPSATPSPGTTNSSSPTALRS